MRALCFTLGLCLIGFVASLSAHETWLLPATFTAAANAEVRLDLTSGMAFPATEYTIRPERVARATLRVGGETSEMKEFKTLEKALRLTATMPRGGLAALWVELHPRALELSDDKVAEYLDEIGATDGTRAAWALRQGRGKWRETYTKHAKTFVGVDAAAAADDSWREPVGMGLELVPRSHPQGLRPGQPATFQLLSKGKPMAGAPVGLLAEGAAGRVFRKTDAEGLASFQVERAGRILVFAVDLRLAKGGATWESNFTTLTLQVPGN